MNAPRPWAIRPEPQESELLSSYLVRVAHLHGMSAYRFCSFYFSGINIWNRDIDRAATDTLISAIALYSGQTKGRIEALTLHSWRAILGRPRVLGHPRPAIDSWLNAVGIFHRKRKGFGMQFCAQCLAETAYFKKEWRLSFVTVCLQHGCSLTDCCGHCQAPVCMHRNDALMCHCWNCGLRLSTCSLSYDEGLDERLYGQAQMMKVLTQNLTDSDTAGFDGGAYFSGISLLLRSIKYRLAHMEPISQPGAPFMHCAGERIEIQRLPERAEQCRFIFGLLESWPESLVHLSNELRLTQCSIDKREAVSSWLQPAISLLPTGSRRNRKRKSAPVRLALRQVHRKKADGWRTDRAKLLFAAARVAA